MEEKNKMYFDDYNPEEKHETRMQRHGFDNDDKPLGNISLEEETIIMDKIKEINGNEEEYEKENKDEEEMYSFDDDEEDLDYFNIENKENDSEPIQSLKDLEEEIEEDIEEETTEGKEDLDEEFNEEEPIEVETTENEDIDKEIEEYEKSINDFYNDKIKIQENIDQIIEESEEDINEEQEDDTIDEINPEDSFSELTEEDEQVIDADEDLEEEIEVTEAEEDAYEEEPEEKTPEVEEDIEKDGEIEEETEEATNENEEDIEEDLEDAPEEVTDIEEEIEDETDIEEPTEIKEVVDDKEPEEETIEDEEEDQEEEPEDEEDIDEIVESKKEIKKAKENEVVSQKETIKETKTNPKPSFFIAVVISLIILIGLVALGFKFVKSLIPDRSGTDEISQMINDDGKDEKIDIKTDVSKNWEEYKVAINDTLITLPTPYEEIEKLTKWTVKSDYESTTIPADHYTLLSLYKEARLALNIEVKNNTNETIKYNEGDVTRIIQTQYQSSLGVEKITFPGNLQVGMRMTKSKLIDILGKPNKTDTYANGKYVSELYKYTENKDDSTTNYYSIKIVNGKIDELALDHRK